MNPFKNLLVEHGHVMARLCVCFVVLKFLGRSELQITFASSSQKHYPRCQVTVSPRNRIWKTNKITVSFRHKRGEQIRRDKQNSVHFVNSIHQQLQHCSVTSVLTLDVVSSVCNLHNNGRHSVEASVVLGHKAYQQKAMNDELSDWHLVMRRHRALLMKQYGLCDVTATTGGDFGMFESTVDAAKYSKINCSRSSRWKIFRLYDLIYNNKSSPLSIYYVHMYIEATHCKCSNIK